VVKWLKGLFSSKDARSAFTLQQEKLSTPWASFEINGFSDDGQVKVNFSWNPAFIKKLKELGFQAETAEDSVQLFFFTSSLRPSGLAADPTDDPVQSAAHPSLSSISNELRV
jgi:hypothetical protein